MPGPLWTEDERKMLRKLAGKVPAAEIARRITEKFGKPRNVSSVHNQALRLGISLPNPQVKGPAPAPATAPESVRLKALRSELRALRSRIGKLEVALGKEQEMSDRLLAALDALPAPRPWKPRSTPSTEQRKPPAVPVICLADWHIGEVISKEETVGFGVYNWKVARQRAHRYVDDVTAWLATQRRGYQIEEGVIAVLGDMVSGEIHRELSLTNEFDPPVAAAHCAHLLTEVVRRLAALFTRCRMVCVTPDNHGRLFDARRPTAKRAATRNWNYVVYEIAAAYLREIRHLTIERPKAIRFPVKIGRFVFLVEHGHAVRQYMGTPHYGLMRQRGREAMRHMAVGERFDYQLFAHWHNPFSINGQICCGCLSGSSEFDLTQSRFAPPSQRAFLVGPHGVFGDVDFRLDRPDRESRNGR